MQIILPETIRECLPVPNKPQPWVYNPHFKKQLWWLQQYIFFDCRASWLHNLDIHFEHQLWSRAKWALWAKNQGIKQSYAYITDKVKRSCYWVSSRYIDGTVCDENRRLPLLCLWYMWYKHLKDQEIRIFV